MNISGRKTIHPSFIGGFFTTIIAGFFIAALILLLSGCGGSSTSSSGGSAEFSTSKTMVRGNINSVSGGLAFNIYDSDSFSVTKVFNVVSEIIVPNALADGRVVEGIEVCIEGICTLTDANGSFQLDLAGVPGGTYVISFSFDGATYSSELEIVDDAIVTMENISIADDGVVRVNNLKIVLLEEEEPDVVVIDDDVSEDDVSEDIDDVVAARVAVCHKPGTPAEKMLYLPASALKGHLGHGDFEGDCSAIKI